MAHARGPWFVSNIVKDTVVYHEQHVNIDLPEIPGRMNSFIDCNSEEDARLVAAAPEMLQALLNAIDYIDGCGAQSGANKAIMDIQFVIDKATGGKK